MGVSPPRPGRAEQQQPLKHLCSALQHGAQEADFSSRVSSTWVKSYGEHLSWIFAGEGNEGLLMLISPFSRCYFFDL